MPALSASAAARIQSSPVEAQDLEIVPVRCDSRTRRSNEECTSEENQKQEVVSSLRHGDEDEEDVAVQKEEGREWQINARPNDDENGRHAIDSQQDEDTKREKADEQGEITNEDRMETKQIVDEDRTRIADEDLRKIDHRQEIEHIQENTIDTLPNRPFPIVPVSPPVPESPSRLAELQLFPLEKVLPARSLVPRSQHARLSSFQHVLSQTRPPRSQFCFLHTQNRLPRSQYLRPQSCVRSSHDRQGKKPRTTYCLPPPVIARPNVRPLIVQLFVPPPRKRRHRFELALARPTFGDCLSHSEEFLQTGAPFVAIHEGLETRIQTRYHAVPVLCTSRPLAHEYSTMMELLAARTRLLAKGDVHPAVAYTHAARSYYVPVTDLDHPEYKKRKPRQVDWIVVTSRSPYVHIASPKLMDPSWSSRGCAVSRFVFFAIADESWSSLEDLVGTAPAEERGISTEDSQYSSLREV